MPTVTHNDVLLKVESLAQTAHSTEELMQGLVQALQENLLKYNWVGFYMLDHSGSEPMLQLGPFVGAMTPHTRIPLDQGICGAAAASGKTVVVDDVNKDPRYLACSIETKSEIVVPIFAHGTVVGELDIDSHFAAAFGAEDRKLCEACAAIVGKFIERKR